MTVKYILSVLTLDLELSGLNNLTKLHPEYLFKTSCLLWLYCKVECLKKKKIKKKSNLYTLFGVKYYYYRGDG